MRRLRSFGRNRSGSSMVEFAIVMPILILLTLGIVDIGRMAWTVSALGQSAREAARYASLRGATHDTPVTAEDIATAARNFYIGLDPDGLASAVLWSPDNTPGSNVTVTVSIEFRFLTIGAFSDDTLTLNGESTVAILNV